MNKAFEIALGEAGHTEVRGGVDNPEILKYFTGLGFTQKWVHDETSWCAASAYWCLKEAGFKYKKALNARSFLKDVGTVVTEPQLGDLVVFWRGSHEDEYIAGSNLKKGHVGWWLNEVGNFTVCYGGNQANQFKISKLYKSRVLGYIRPVKLDLI